MKRLLVLAIFVYNFCGSQQSERFLSSFHNKATESGITFWRLQVRGHPLSTYANVRVRIKVLEMLVFGKILHTYLMDDPIWLSYIFVRLKKWILQKMRKALT